MPKTTTGLLTAIAALTLVSGCSADDKAPEDDASAAQRVVRAAWDKGDDAHRAAVCDEYREMGRTATLDELTTDMDGATHAQQRAAWGKILDQECAG